MSQTDPWVGERLRLHRKAKGLDQEVLGEMVSDKITQWTGSPPLRGLSKSAISRIERGNMVPSQLKMQALIDVLEIKDPLEVRRIFERCGYALPESSLETGGHLPSLQQSVNKNPHDLLNWLYLISTLNQEKRYDTALEKIQLAQELFHESTADLREQIFLLLLKSKWHFALAMRDTSVSQAVDAALLISSYWAQEAWRNFKEHESQFVMDHNLPLFKAEILKTLISPGFEIFLRRYSILLTEANYQQAEQEYQSLLQHITSVEVYLQHTPQQASREQRMSYLYFEREKIRLMFKWAEMCEAYAVVKWFAHHCPEYLAFGQAVSMQDFGLKLFKSLSEDPRLGLVLQNMFVRGIEGGLWFSPAPELAEKWSKITEAAHQSLQNHRLFLPADQSPLSMLNTSLVETFLLLPLAQLKSGKFNVQQSLLELDTLFLLTAYPQSYFSWHYIKACLTSGACIIQAELNYEDLATAWQAWCSAGKPQPGFAPLHFSAFLQEPLLWSCFASLLQSPPAEGTATYWLFAQLQQWSKNLKDLPQKD